MKQCMYSCNVHANEVILNYQHEMFNFVLGGQKLQFLLLTIMNFNFVNNIKLKA